MVNAKAEAWFWVLLFLIGGPYHICSLNAAIFENGPSCLTLLMTIIFYPKTVNSRGEVIDFIPVNFHKFILKDIHDDIKGHLGTIKTYVQICDSCYLLKMKVTLCEYVSSCGTCHRFHNRNGKIQLVNRIQLK